VQRNNIVDNLNTYNVDVEDSNYFTSLLCLLFLKFRTRPPFLLRRPCNGSGTPTRRYCLRPGSLFTAVVHRPESLLSWRCAFSASRRRRRAFPRCGASASPRPTGDCRSAAAACHRSAGGVGHRSQRRKPSTFFIFSMF
jgi:hypothetical protein